MGKKRTDDHSSESGVALVMALILVTVMLLLIASLTYLMTSGYQANTINRKFSTVYDAANGGVEFSNGVITAYLKGSTPQNIGPVSDLTALSDIISSCSTGTATIGGKTADGNYKIDSTVACLGNKPIPGYGGALRFPPPPAVTGGGAAGLGTSYQFYSIVSKATETANPQHIGQTEAIDRVIR